MVLDEDSYDKTKDQLNNKRKELSGKASIVRKMNKCGGQSDTLWERLVEKIDAPKVNWRSICRKYLIDYSSTVK